MLYWQDRWEEAPVDGGAAGIVYGADFGAADDGCAFILDADGGRSGGAAVCGVPRRARSSYCERHHALCHIAEGSPGEGRRARETEALAAAVGGKRGRAERRPSDRFLRRLEHAVRNFSRAECSRIVRNGDRNGDSA
jgi:hypothetical protein